METDRHGYCEHNRRDHKCWECQAQRARAAELRVAELEAERSDKEIAYDLDQAGVKSRAADAAELVELRARVVHLEDVERGMAAALRLTNASKATAEAKAMESGADLRAERVRITDLQAQLDRAKADGGEVSEAARGACRYVYARDRKFVSTELKHLDHVLHKQLIKKSVEEQEQLDRAAEPRGDGKCT